MPQITLAMLWRRTSLHWFSKLQRSVTLSSAEAEYFGGMLSARDGMFFRDLTHFLDVLTPTATVMYSDLKSAVAMALDPVAFKQTKHILRAAEFLRDLVARCVFTFAHTPGATMMADILTKAVVRPLFIELFKLIEKCAADGLAVPSSALAAALGECS